MARSDVTHTPDGRHIVLDGRRWQATDPAIPGPLRQELVTELMAARRAVRAAAGKPETSAHARRRVHNAKVALGERGEPWWEAPSAAGLDARVRAAVSALLSKRGRASSICPSEVARIVASPDWRSVMDDVRVIVGRMADRNVIVVTQGHEQVRDLEGGSGPVRLRLP